MIASSEVAILRRIIEPKKPGLQPSLARLILCWRFSDEDRQHMHNLLEKAKEGTLTRDEKMQAENYERLGYFLSVLKSKARISLRAKSAAF